jgi:hypothetical protein
MDNARGLSARLVANLLADRENATSGDLIADVVRGVLDEHRQDVLYAAPASLLLEARHRLTRLERARSETPDRRLPGAQYDGCERRTAAG